MATVLIAGGADINYKLPYRPDTTWQTFLARNGVYLRTNKWEYYNLNMVPLMSLFLEAGADPGVRIKDGETMDSPQITLPEYFEKYIRRQCSNDPLAGTPFQAIKEKIQFKKVQLRQQHHAHDDSEISTADAVSPAAVESVPVRRN